LPNFINLLRSSSTTIWFESILFVVHIKRPYTTENRSQPQCCDLEGWIQTSSIIGPLLNELFKIIFLSYCTAFIAVLAGWSKNIFRNEKPQDERSYCYHYYLRSTASVLDSVGTRLAGAFRSVTRDRPQQVRRFVRAGHYSLTRRNRYWPPPGVCAVCRLGYNWKCRGRPALSPPRNTGNHDDYADSLFIYLIYRTTNYYSICCYSATKILILW